MSDQEKEVERLNRELGRAWRALYMFWNAYKGGQRPDETALGYHSLTIAGACRFVENGSMEGSDHFIGKAPEVMQQALQYLSER